MLEDDTKQAALSEASRGAPPRRLEEPNPVRGLPRTPPRSPERLREGPRAAPSYPALAQASAQGIDDAMVQRCRGDEYRGPSAGPHECHRAAGWLPQYAELYTNRRQEAQDHRAHTERDRRQDAEVAQRLDRLTRRLDVLEHENKELRRRVPRCQPPQRGQDWDKLVNGSFVAGNKRGMVSPQPTGVESRMKPERCR
ncbi:hypothetical protein PF010_g7020 [Phytophthora fragariae]|uniref:Uncharacterized protein n=1 Tax=Phytophthora fragariae TaxID=53985 RepID=A0A6A4EWF7_9STRA|nr:hypothetical protein PF010_g7020 [Phytophthora fragariae]KAE9328445.1 hypothetical protein PF001_g1411 [Phytophthora fragariae]